MQSRLQQLYERKIFSEKQFIPKMEAYRALRREN